MTQPGTLTRQAYLVQRDRVVDAQRHLVAELVAGSDPGQLRAAGRELRSALATATAAAVRAMSAERAMTDASRPRRRTPPLGFRRAPGRPWEAELGRLGRLRTWLDITLSDALGALPPTVVQPSSRAALGPRIPGMVSEPSLVAAVPGREPGIGIALRASVDARVTVTADPVAVQAAVQDLRKARADRAAARVA